MRLDGWPVLVGLSNVDACTYMQDRSECWLAWDGDLKHETVAYQQTPDNASQRQACLDI
jgi:hypothetical protein